MQRASDLDERVSYTRAEVEQGLVNEGQRVHPRVKRAKRGFRRVQRPKKGSNLIFKGQKGHLEGPGRFKQAFWTILTTFERSETCS